MPSRVSNGLQGVTPVVVEVKPKHVSPSSPSSPKAVRFAPSSDQKVSRPLTNTEEWSIYNFESHAVKCQACYKPYRIYKEGGRLCSEGHALAQDVALNIFYKSGDVYSRQKEDHKLVRVELMPGYHHVMGLLRSMDHHIRSASRSQPAISYDRNYPVQSARHSRERTPEYQSDRRDRRESVVVEPATTRPERRSAERTSRHPGKRYEPVVVNEDIEATQPATTKYKERRGSLYDAEMARLEREKRYRVEVREPESSRRRDRDGRRRERYD